MPATLSRPAKRHQRHATLILGPSRSDFKRLLLEFHVASVFALRLVLFNRLNCAASPEIAARLSVILARRCRSGGLRDDLDADVADVCAG